MTSLGYGIAPADAAAAPHGHEQTAHDDEGTALPGQGHGPATEQWWKSPKARLTAAAGLALIVAYVIGKLAPTIGPWAFVTAMLVGLGRLRSVRTWRRVPAPPFLLRP